MDRAFVRRYERINKIIEITLREGVAHVADMAAQFELSKSMISRDFNLIQSKGSFKHLHGKLIATGDPLTVAESDVTPSTAMAVAQLIGENQAIILEDGEVSLQLAKHISKDLRVVVVTNSLIVAMTFIRNSYCYFRSV